MTAQITTPLYPAEVTLPVGATLRVWAEEGDAGFVMRRPADGYKAAKTWLNAGTPVELGPFTAVEVFLIKATLGGLSYEVKEAIVATLERATDIVRSQRIIATALNEGKRAMSLVERMQNLAERAKAVPTALAERTDASLARLTAVETRGHAALDGIDSVIGEAEKAAASTEDAVNQLTNGAPLPKSS